MIERHTLKNGVRVLIEKRQETPITSIMVLVKTGSRNETSEINGISHVIEHMSFRGTKKRPTSEIVAKEIDSMGAFNNAMTDNEYTGYYMKADYDHFEKSLDFVSDITFSPLLKESDLKKEKGTILEEMNRLKDNPSSYIWRLFENVVFEDELLAQDVIGTEETVLSLNSKILKDYHHKYYLAGNTVVSIVGKVPDNYLELLEKYFGQLEQGSTDYLASVSKNSLFKKGVMLEERKTEQTQLALGLQSYNKKDSKRPRATLLSIILGGNTSSRLWRKIREERGLAYSVGTAIFDGSDHGIFTVYGGINNKSIEEVIQIVKDELVTVSRNVTDNELKRAKEYSKGMISLAAENSVEVAEKIAIDEMVGSGARTIEERISELNKVTLEDLKDTAHEIFKPENFKLALIGPFKDEEKFVKILKS